MASVAILILYSRVLPESEYGDYQEFWVKLLLLGTLAYAGLPITIITYAADVVKALAAHIQRKHLVYYGLWFLCWAAVFAWFLHRDLQQPAWLGIGLILMYVVHAVQEALILSSKKMNSLVVINLVYAACFFLVHVWMLKEYNLQTLLLWLLIIMLLRALALSFIVSTIYKRIKPAALSEERRSKARQLWLHLGFYDLLQNTFRFADKFILSSLLAAGVYAIYFNGAQAAEVPFLPYLLGAVSTSILLHLSGGHEPAGQSYKLLQKSGVLLSCIVFPLFFFLMFFSSEFFVVILTEKYLPSVPVFMVAILVLPQRAYNFTVLLQHMEKGAIINRGALLDLVIALALMYPFYRLFDLPGIVLGFVVSTYIQVSYYIYHTARFSGTSIRQLLPLKNWLLKLVVYGIILWLSHRGLSSILEPVQALIAGFLIMCMLAGGSFLQEWRRATQKENFISQ